MIVEKIQELEENINVLEENINKEFINILKKFVNKYESIDNITAGMGIFSVVINGELLTILSIISSTEMKEEDFLKYKQEDFYEDLMSIVEFLNNNKNLINYTDIYIE